MRVWSFQIAFCPRKHDQSFQSQTSESGQSYAEAYALTNALCLLLYKYLEELELYTRSNTRETFAMTITLKDK